MRLNHQVTFLGVTLRRLRSAFIRKGSDVWKKDGVIVLKTSKGQFFTNQEKAFRSYNEYFDFRIAEGLFALKAIDTAVLKKFKSQAEDRARDRAVKNDVFYLHTALKNLKLKPSAAQAKLLKKYGFKI
jgi:hypothetical protein